MKERGHSTNNNVGDYGHRARPHWFWFYDFITIPTCVLLVALIIKFIINVT